MSDHLEQGTPHTWKHVEHDTVEVDGETYHALTGVRDDGTVFIASGLHLEENVRPAFNTYLDARCICKPNQFDCPVHFLAVHGFNI